MKRIIGILLAAVLITGCGTSEEPQSSIAAIPVPEKEELPVHLTCLRYYEYGATAETDDPETIAALFSIVSHLEPGEESTYAVEDFTDVLIFQWADGTEVSYVFEEYNYVAEDGKRYHTEGLGPLRRILNELFIE